MSLATFGARRPSWQAVALALAVVGLSGLVFLHAYAVGIASALDGGPASIAERALSVCSWLVLAAGAALGWAIVVGSRRTRGAFVGWALTVALVLGALRLVPATIQDGRRRAVAALLMVATIGWVLPRARRAAV